MGYQRRVHGEFRQRGGVRGGAAALAP